MVLRRVVDRLSKETDADAREEGDVVQVDREVGASRPCAQRELTCELIERGCATGPRTKSRGPSAHTWWTALNTLSSTAVGAAGGGYGCFVAD
jgi:hypothetical protein